MKFQTTFKPICFLCLSIPASVLHAQDALVPLKPSTEEESEVLLAQETIVKAFERTYKNEEATTGLGFQAEPKNVKSGSPSAPSCIGPLSPVSIFLAAPSP